MVGLHERLLYGILGVGGGDGVGDAERDVAVALDQRRERVHIPLPGQLHELAIHLVQVGLLLDDRCSFYTAHDLEVPHPVAEPVAGGIDPKQTPAVDHRRAPASAVALVAGACGAVQPKINAVLGARLDSALVAALVNFAVALSIALVAVSFRPATRRRLRRIPTWEVPRWTFGAGLGGAIVVIAGAVTVERIGVAVFSVAFFAGQITAGLLVDRLGLAPGGARAITAAPGAGRRAGGRRRGALPGRPRGW